MYISWTTDAKVKERNKPKRFGMPEVQCVTLHLDDPSLLVKRLEEKKQKRRQQISNINKNAPLKEQGISYQHRYASKLS